MRRARALSVGVTLALLGGCSLDFASLSSRSDGGSSVPVDGGSVDAHGDAARGDAALDAGAGLDGGADAGMPSAMVLTDTSGLLSFTISGGASLGAGAVAVGRSPVGAELPDDGVVAVFGAAPWIARVGGLGTDSLASVVSVGAGATAVGSTASSSAGAGANVDALVVTIDETRVVSVQHWGTLAGLDERFHAVTEHEGELFMAGSIGPAGGSSPDGLLVFGAAARVALRFGFPQPTEFFAVAASTDTIYLAGERASAPPQGVVIAITRATPHMLLWSRAISGASGASIRGLSADAAGVVAVGRQEGRAIRWSLAQSDGRDRTLHTVGSGLLTSIVSGAGFEYLLGVTSGAPATFRLVSGTTYAQSSWPDIGRAPDLPGALVRTATGLGMVGAGSRVPSEVHWLAGEAGIESACARSAALTSSPLGAGGSASDPTITPVADLSTLPWTDAVTAVASSVRAGCSEEP